MTETPPKVYADTSVFGGVFDKEFAAPSQAFFQQVEKGFLSLQLSELVQNEISPSPEKVRLLFDRTLETASFLTVTQGALELRNAYLEAGILSEKCVADALHVALATFHRCDFIVSWNFRHLVHYDKNQMYNRVNNQLGYDDIAIYSPLEVIPYDNETKDI